MTKLWPETLLKAIDVWEEHAKQHAKKTLFILLYHYFRSFCIAYEISEGMQIYWLVQIVMKHFYNANNALQQSQSKRLNNK